MKLRFRLSQLREHPPRDYRLYKMRRQMVESVFGQIKVGRRCDRFMRRGHQACANEWEVLCATQNLLKLWRSGKASWASRTGKVDSKDAARDTEMSLSEACVRTSSPRKGHRRNPNQSGL
ncbi:MAG: transposase [Nitrospirota bacterium]|nr:transposase [Nitrospirota bacterium]